MGNIARDEKNVNDNKKIPHNHQIDIGYWIWQSVNLYDCLLSVYLERGQKI